MSKPISERALCEIAKRLSKIRTEDGYLTDAGLHVYRARRNVDKKSLPALVVWDNGETPNGDTLPSADTNMDLSVAVDALGQADQDDTGFVLEHLKADVKRALFGFGNANGRLEDAEGKIAAIGYSGAQTFAREIGAVSESITLNFVVRFKENLAQPY